MFALIFMSSFVIVGYESMDDCMAAREAVIRQFGRNLDAGAICVQLPKKDWEVVGRGAQTGSPQNGEDDKKP